jgi:hypothetical protein
MTERKQQEVEDFLKEQHSAFHHALSVTPIRKGDRIDFETGDIIKGNGEIIGYEDSQPLSSNLHGKNCHSDRLLDHFLAFKDVLAESKCNCAGYADILRKKRTEGERGEFMSLRRRLLKMV